MIYTMKSTSIRSSPGDSPISATVGCGKIVGSRPLELRAGGVAPSPAVAPAFVRSADRSNSAYELKFLLSDVQAREVESLLRRSLEPDPHGDPNAGNAYIVTSLYCDTPQFDVFYRVGFGKRRKHRLRRYGDESCLYLERKTRSGDKVRKRRTCIGHNDLQRLSVPAESTNGPVESSNGRATIWEADWFHRQLSKNDQRPVCLIAYERVAYVGTEQGEPVRLTFDRRIRGVLANEWCVDSFAGGTSILSDGVVCEFKFRGAMPAIFKEALSALHLAPASVSKYRFLMQAAGQLPLRRPVDA